MSLLKRGKPANSDEPKMMKVYRAVRAPTPDTLEMQRRASVLRSMLANNPPDAVPSAASELKGLEASLAMLSKHTLIASPGVDYPEVDEFFTIVPKASLLGPDNDGRQGASARVLRTIAVPFIDGVAEVDSRIGKHLISRKMAFAKPQMERMA